VNIRQLRGALRYCFGVWSANTSASAERHYAQFKDLFTTLEKHVGELTSKTILDIGCGRMVPFSLLLNSLGNKTIGIDVNYVGYNDPLHKVLWKELKHNGF
jgi:hypothetical protein